MINVIKDMICFCLTICHNEMFVDSSDQMVFEGAFDKLMENIWSYDLMNVHTREVICK